MIRTELINHLVRLRNFRSYLEVSVHDEENNFAHIECSHKVTTLGSSSDYFFEHNCEKFDLIFIDGFHTEEQVLKDLKNSFRCLAENGITVIHDCMPPDEWHQREPEHFREGENWNG